MQVCLLLVSIFPLFSMKVAADHAHNTQGKFPSPGPWWHSALVTKSFMVTTLQFVGRFIVGFGVSLSAIAECIYISEIAPAVSTVIMTLTPQSNFILLLYQWISASWDLSRPAWLCLWLFVLVWFPLFRNEIIRNKP